MSLPNSSSDGHVKVLEPHVSYFDIHSSEKQALTLPFQLMSYLLLFFVVIGFYYHLVQGENSITPLITWLFAIFAPFYFPGIYLFNQYMVREQRKQVEIDERYQYIQYVDRHTGENILFHVDQVDRVTLNMSMMFPYGVDYMSMYLKGGKVIHISSLVVSPRILINAMGFEYEIKERVFNPFPAR
ncbi:MAG: hypothetical protein AAFQ83_03990 [Bacteroidota bacterium]